MADILDVRNGEKCNLSRQLFMNGKFKIIISYLLLNLLAATLIVSGKLINKKSSPPEKDYATKLAELRADLTQAAKASNISRNNTLTTAHKST